MGAMRVDLWMVKSTRRVRWLLERYSGDLVILACMFRRISSSISKNSMGARRIVISEWVTRAVAMKLMASMGSSEIVYSTSWFKRARPLMVRRVVPMPEILTPSCSRKKQTSWTM